MRQFVLVPLIGPLLGLGAAANPELETLMFMYPSHIDGTTNPPFSASAAITAVISSQTTVAHINCPLHQNTVDCPYGSGIEYTIISGTQYKWTDSSAGLYTQTLDCTDIPGNASVVCKSYEWDGEAPDNTVDELFVWPRSYFQFLDAAVTKGAELLTAGMAAASSFAGSNSSTSSLTSAMARNSGTSEEMAQSTGAGHCYGVEGSALLAAVGGLAALLH